MDSDTEDWWGLREAAMNLRVEVRQCLDDPELAVDDLNMLLITIADLNKVIDFCDQKLGLA